MRGDSGGGRWILVVWQLDVLSINRVRSLTFSNDRLLSLCLTFPDLYQYPRILKIF